MFLIKQSLLLADTMNLTQAAEVKLTRLFYLQLYNSVLNAERQENKKQKQKQKQVHCILFLYRSGHSCCFSRFPQNGTVIAPYPKFAKKRQNSLCPNVEKGGRGSKERFRA